MIYDVEITNRPLISLIVALYCAEPYLTRCIDSILEQTHRNLELILVDDGSTDKSPAICDQYAATDDRIIVIHQENMGVSASRNVGLNHSHGDYITFVDSDDWIEPDYVSTLLDVVTRFPVRISACNHFVYARGLDYAKYPVDESTVVQSLRQSLENILYHLPPDVSPWGKLYHKSLFENLRYPEGKIFEDTWRIADLLVAAGNIAYSAKPMYHYRFHAKAISKNEFSQKSWDFYDAVDHMTQVVLQYYPELTEGCIRRRVHAALSIRRLINSETANSSDDLVRCESIIRNGAKSVLFNKHAPNRDKAGILLLLAGRRLFDSAWGLYDKIRLKY